MSEIAGSTLRVNRFVDHINQTLLQPYQWVGIFHIQLTNWLKEEKHSNSSLMKNPILQIPNIANYLLFKKMKTRSHSLCQHTAPEAKLHTRLPPGDIRPIHSKLSLLPSLQMGYTKMKDSSSNRKGRYRDWPGRWRTSVPIVWPDWWERLSVGGHNPCLRFCGCWVWDTLGIHKPRGCTWGINPLAHHGTSR